MLFLSQFPHHPLFLFPLLNYANILSPLPQPYPVAHAPRNINRRIPTLKDLENEVKAAVPTSEVCICNYIGILLRECDIFEFEYTDRKCQDAISIFC